MGGVFIVSEWVTPFSIWLEIDNHKKKLTYLVTLKKKIFCKGGVPTTNLLAKSKKKKKTQINNQEKNCNSYHRLRAKSPYYTKKSKELIRINYK